MGANPKPLPAEENERINADLTKCIAWLKEHRKTHVDWRDWLRRNPSHPGQEDLGDADFHNEMVQRYDSILAVLETMLEIPAMEDVDA